MSQKSWRVVLGSEAEKDFVRVLANTRELFGPRQEAVYEATILAAIAEFDFGPDISGSLSRDELRPGMRSMHVARHGRRGRHVIFYTSRRETVIEVVRILYDGMEFARHIPPDAD